MDELGEPLRECMWSRTEIAVADFVCREVRRSLGDLYKRDIGFVGLRP